MKSWRKEPGDTRNGDESPARCTSGNKFVNGEVMAQEVVNGEYEANREHKRLD